MDTRIDKQKARRALEALRNGVPNMYAVDLLGCNQPQAEGLFKDLLSKVENLNNPPTGALGMLVSGDFGTGKSHLLSYLEHQALSQGFVCSKVAVSKETPLYSLDKVFKSAVDHGRIPDLTGQLIDELSDRLRPDSDEYSRFKFWADSEQNGLNQIFPATLAVHQRVNDFDLIAEIRSFWSGNTIRTPRVKEGLRGMSQLSNYSFMAPKKSDLPRQQLRFATELVKCAGYKGWVVLLDEIELVGSYSLLQRARSYAELARWLGKIPGEELPGVVVVGTVTDDYISKILGPNGKNDHDYVGPRMRSRGEDAVAARAEAGIRFLEQDVIQLKEPTEEDENATVENLRQIYAAAYGWDAPRVERTPRGGTYQNRMRYKVRASINQWDLLRLYPDSRPETEETEFRFRYDETPELERDVKDDGVVAEQPELY